jgi:hypothetical protein
LAFAISFGFGTRDVIRNITAGFYTREFLRVGSRLEISGQQGVLTGIHATHMPSSNRKTTKSASPTQAF